MRSSRRFAATHVLAVVLLTAVAAGAAEPQFTMEDLTALEKQESWQEVLLHLSDVAPAKRDDGWMRLLEPKIKVRDERRHAQVPHQLRHEGHRQAGEEVGQQEPAVSGTT